MTHFRSGPGLKALTFLLLLCITHWIFLCSAQSWVRCAHAYHHIPLINKSGPDWPRLWIKYYHSYTTCTLRPKRPGSDHTHAHAPWANLNGPSRTQSGSGLPGAPSAPFPPFGNLHLGLYWGTKRSGPENPPFLWEGATISPPVPDRVRLHTCRWDPLQARDTPSPKQNVSPRVQGCSFTIRYWSRSRSSSGSPVLQFSGGGSPN